MCICLQEALKDQRDATAPCSILACNDLVWDLNSILLCYLFICKISFPELLNGAFIEGVFSNFF